MTTASFSYDKDKNNEPCLSNGHSAHWAVLTGMNSYVFKSLQLFKNLFSRFYDSS